jgi:hypothetical protein
VEKLMSCTLADSLLTKGPWAKIIPTHALTRWFSTHKSFVMFDPKGYSGDELMKQVKANSFSSNLNYLAGKYSKEGSFIVKNGLGTQYTFSVGGAGTLDASDAGSFKEKIKIDKNNTDEYYSCYTGKLFPLTEGPRTDKTRSERGKTRRMEGGGLGDPWAAASSYTLPAGPTMAGGHHHHHRLAERLRTSIVAAEAAKLGIEAGYRQFATDFMSWAVPARTVIGAQLASYITDPISYPLLSSQVIAMATEPDVDAFLSTAGTVRIGPINTLAEYSYPAVLRYYPPVTRAVTLIGGGDGLAGGMAGGLLPSHQEILRKAEQITGITKSIAYQTDAQNAEERKGYTDDQKAKMAYELAAVVDKELSGGKIVKHAIYSKINPATSYVDSFYKTMIVSSIVDPNAAFVTGSMLLAPGVVINTIKRVPVVPIVTVAPRYSLTELLTMMYL